MKQEFFPFVWNSDVTHQFRRYQIPTSVTLCGTNVQQRIFGIHAVLEPHVVACFTYVLKLSPRILALRTSEMRSSVLHPSNSNEQRRLFPFRLDHNERTILMTNFVISAGRESPLKDLSARISFHFLSPARITSFEWYIGFVGISNCVA